jgi:hypothetical protein
MTENHSGQLLKAVSAVAAITCGLLFLGVVLDLPALFEGGFFSDCATYYALATSLANDLDIEYQRADLQRIYADFKGGPSGIFLQRNPDTGRLYYGKAYIYPIALAGPVRLFGHRGVLITHALLLGAVLLCMTVFWERRWGAIRALAVALAFLVPSVITVYYFWIAPEFFNFCLIFFAYFFWLYKEVNPKEPDDNPPAWRAALLKPWTDVAAAVLIGAAVFSKLSNGVMALPLLVYLLFGRRWLRLVAAFFAVALATAAFFGIQQLVTGHWNYQGGERKSFTYEYPFAKELSFDNASQEAKVTDPESYKPPFYPADIAWNVVYFFIGRFGGVIPYYFPAALFLALFLVFGRGKGSLFRWLVFGGAVSAMLSYIVLIPANFIGGGGTVANRYFMNIAPLFFFLIPERTPKWAPLAAVMGGALFAGHILVTPVSTSLYPARYAETPVLRMLPVEYTMLNDLPINTNRERTRVEWYRVRDGKVPAGENGYPQVSFYTYQLDYASFLKEPAPARSWPRRDAEGDWDQRLVTEQGRQMIWTEGGRSAEMIIRTGEPIGEIQIDVSNSDCFNNVTLSLAGSSQSLQLEPREKVSLVFKPGPGFAYHYLSTSYLYHLTVAASNGVVPRTMPGDTSNDYRYLGVMLEFRIID